MKTSSSVCIPGSVTRRVTQDVTDERRSLSNRHHACWFRVNINVKMVHSHTTPYQSINFSTRTASSFLQEFSNAAQSSQVCSIRLTHPGIADKVKLLTTGKYSDLTITCQDCSSESIGLSYVPNQAGSRSWLTESLRQVISKHKYLLVKQHLRC